MNHLYIIGNGFDLHHGMRTKYIHFRDWLETNSPETLYLIEDLLCDSNSICSEKKLWKDFERNLANAVTSNIILEEINEHLPDFGSDDFRDSDWFVAEHAVEDRLDKAHIEILSAFQKWIEGIGDGDKAKLIKLENRDAAFISFNYTDTLEKLYHIEENILHIHGKADQEDSDLIFGHGVSEQEIRNMLNRSFPIDMEDGGSNGYITQRAQEAAISVVYYKRKKVEQILHSHKEWFESLKGISNIHIFGHSLGEVDLPYFHKVFSIVDRTKITVEISDHNNENRATIANFMRTESISEEQYSIVDLNDLLIRNQ